MALFSQGRALGNLAWGEEEMQTVYQKLKLLLEFYLALPSAGIQTGKWFPLPFHFFPVFLCSMLWTFLLMWLFPSRAHVSGTGNSGCDCFLPSPAITSKSTCCSWLLLFVCFLCLCFILAQKVRMHLCAERGLQVVFAQPASLGNAANQSSATVTVFFSCGGQTD